MRNGKQLETLRCGAKGVQASRLARQRTGLEACRYLRQECLPHLPIRNPWNVSERFSIHRNLLQDNRPYERAE